MTPTWSEWFAKIKAANPKAGAFEMAMRMQAVKFLDECHPLPEVDTTVTESNALQANNKTV